MTGRRDAQCADDRCVTVALNGKRTMKTREASNSVKRIVRDVVIALSALVLGIHSAYAGPFGGRHAREGSRYVEGDMQAQSQRDIQRSSLPPPEARRENPMAHRLSPEERRQLRRDIQDAGREIYAPRR
jgi:hypothetical protein